MKTNLPKPTESELEILQILWQNDSCTVREVNEVLSKKREVGYTTTLKLMQIMFAKNLLVREEDGRTHIYKPAIKENDIQKVLVDKLLDTAFGGSAMKLVMQALGSGKTSNEEIGEIKNLLTRLEEENGNGN